jgi:trehalose/maltose hydrolase-like predicted phosphorylase
MHWILKNHKYNRQQIELCGNNLLLANGYMGYRGTLEEYTKEQHTACTLTGIYDQVNHKWREPVNAPNAFYVKIYCNGKPVTILENNVKEHTQLIDFRNAVHKRTTIFKFDNNEITLSSERFVSLDDLHLMCMKYSVSASKDSEITIETGIDGDVWDINGPHLKKLSPRFADNYLIFEAVTKELKQKISVVEGIDINFGRQKINKGKKIITRLIEFEANAGKEYNFSKYVSVFTTNDVAKPFDACLNSVNNAFTIGYLRLCENHKNLWQKRWEDADVIIEGDPKAQFALRFSIYHLMAVAPIHSDKISIPARGLSSQVYKGAIFWDTELYMLPFFIYNFPAIARNLVKYRINSLKGAKLKAKEYGFNGAFYAWESQDNGKEACTHYNVVDVFTGRPLRTYFRDKQIHISGDVVYGIWEYYKATGDEKILLEGGAEVILECARFYYSYAYYSKNKNRYEFLDVTTPDEYHERVNNNPYTNRMVKYTVDVALETIQLLSRKYKAFYNSLISSINFQKDIEKIIDLQEKIYIPGPSKREHIIEQFDGYFQLEDINLKELKSRIIRPNEYLGGANGLATTTKIIKQADVVLMLNQFKEKYSNLVKKANWEFYEPRTEHGSSLSTCMYSMLAARLGKVESAYKYFMKTATIDLNGKYKQYVGTLYIGGTHPAANGGTWLASVFGFAGLTFRNNKPVVQPKLPQKWKKMRFKIQLKDKKFLVEINKNKSTVTSY